MVDAESALFKAKSAYFNRCQAGVKLREELASAQSTLDESQAALVAAATAPAPSPVTPQPSSTPTSSPATNGSADGGGGGDFPSPVDQSLMNAVVKQKAKVERLEKQLGENDKKVSAFVVGFHSK